ncbi:hypothetical protein C8R43DRAFT_1133789 [Mycena crocata]|nr:hypothetical protein C8R43DRAFT_1133789 [Mycena crocata]
MLAAADKPDIHAKNEREMQSGNALLNCCGASWRRKRDLTWLCAKSFKAALCIIALMYRIIPESTLHLQGMFSRFKAFGGSVYQCYDHSIHLSSNIIIPTYLPQNGVVSLEATCRKFVQTCRIVPASSTQPGGIAEAPSRDKMYTLISVENGDDLDVPCADSFQSAVCIGVWSMQNVPALEARLVRAGFGDLWVFVHTLSAEQRTLESAPQRAVSHFVPCGRMEVRGLPALGTRCAIGAAAGSKEDNRKVLPYLVVLDVHFVNGGNRAEMLHVFFLRSGGCATEAIFHYNTSFRYPFAPSNTVGSKGTAYKCVQNPTMKYPKY